jgi:hypothetical protein
VKTSAALQRWLAVLAFILLIISVRLWIESGHWYWMVANGALATWFVDKTATYAGISTIDATTRALLKRAEKEEHR